MTAPTHVLLGAATYAGISLLTPLHFPLAAGALTAACVGSLVPDLDHPSSWLGKRLFFISIPLSALLGHRGLTHSLLAALGIAATLGWYLHAGGMVPWVAAFLIGYLVHLFADWNTGGVPLLWPAKRRFRAPWAFQTGGIIERLFASAFCTGLAYGGWVWFLRGGWK